jgi:hypothetical protein
MGVLLCVLLKSGAIENSSEITISLSFTAEYAESAEASGNQSED